ncbi:MAG: ABC transporter ATP-binding protein [Halioglobus sp.]|nr:ABC transporter ATP-binding protein [Halioglobus sp.]
MFLDNRVKTSSDLDLLTGKVLSVRDVGKCYTLYKKSIQRLLSYLVPGYRAQCETFTALDQISFDLKRGETLGIIGRNGAGKSTLLQILSGTLQPSTGSFSCSGRVAALLELGAGFNPDFTGRENVRLNAAIYGLSESEIEHKMPEIIEFSGIGEFIDRPVRQYSSGMFVRLAFSVIVHVDPDILIIDEALAVGDVLFSQKCMRFLEDFKQRGSILFVSHDAGAVSLLCDRVLWLDGGRQMGLGEPRAMLDRYLEHLYSEQQAVVARESGAPVGDDPVTDAVPVFEAFEPWFDAREAMTGSSALYNAMEVHRFDGSASGFGDGGAAITDACFIDSTGRKLSGILGGSTLALRFTFVAHQSMDPLIVGFLIKDRRGQVILGDNNCVIHHDSPVHAEVGKTYTVSFGITMPYLAVSEYIVSVSVASGTQSEHIQHCWLHDALVFRAEKGPVVHGIMGIPLAFCDITQVPEAL